MVCGTTAVVAPTVEQELPARRVCPELFGARPLQGWLRFLLLLFSLSPYELVRDTHFSGGASRLRWIGLLKLYLYTHTHSAYACTTGTMHASHGTGQAGRAA